MRNLRALAIRIGNLLRSRNHRLTADDFAAELEAHLALDIDRGLRAGLSPTEARRQALIRLGGLQQTREARRRQAGMPWLESLARDLRYGLRTLGRHPAITLIAMLSIGLGIGANATVFAIVNRLVLRPAPVGDPPTLLSLHPLPAGETCCDQFPLPFYNDVRDQARSFSGIAAYYDLIPASIGGSGEPERIWGQGVTTNFFDVAQMPMVLGRSFTAGENDTPVVVLSARVWQRRFRADEHILAKSITLAGRAFTVIGIAPAAFHSIEQILDTQFWVPLGITPQLVPSMPPPDTRDYHWLQVIARLRPGVSRQQAAAELQTLAQRFAIAYPKTDKGLSFVFEQAGSLPPHERSGVLIFLTTLSVIPILLLAVAAANVANLLFAQAAGRQRELAVRLALGATRARLHRQLLLESVLLGIGGGFLGALLALLSTKGLSALHLPAPVPLHVRVGIDWHSLVFTFALSVLCGVVLGIGLVWAASHPRLANALKGEDALQPGGRHLSLRNALVVGQIAISVVLLSMTTLFLRSLQSAANIDIGFRTRGLLMLSIDPRLQGYTPARTSAFLAQLRQRVAALPGVDRAVSTDVPLLSGGNRSDSFTVVGRPNPKDDTAFADLYTVTPGYFDAIGTRRLTGRDFAHDRPDTPAPPSSTRPSPIASSAAPIPSASTSGAANGPTKSSASSATSNRAPSANRSVPSSTAPSTRASPLIRQ
jgi:predicted permease